MYVVYVVYKCLLLSLHEVNVCENVSTKKASWESEVDFQLFLELFDPFDLSSDNWKDFILLSRFPLHQRVINHGNHYTKLVEKKKLGITITMIDNALVKRLRRMQSFKLSPTKWKGSKSSRNAYIYTMYVCTVYAYSRQCGEMKYKQVAYSSMCPTYPPSLRQPRRPT